jgi:hypothetical protein
MRVLPDPHLTRVTDSHRAAMQRWANHRRRVEVLNCVRADHIKVADLHQMVREERALRILTAKDVLRAIGDVDWALEQCRDLKIRPERRLLVMSPKEWARFVGRADSSWRGTRRRGSRRS